MSGFRDARWAGLAVVCLLLPGQETRAQDQVANPHVAISLVPEYREASAGTRLGVAVRFQLEPGWHVYWENPGQSGIPTSIAWSVEPGGMVGALRWPVPELYPIAGVVTHVHHGDMALAATVTLPRSPAASPVRITAEVRYGICRDLCIPGAARLVLELPWTGRAPQPDPRWAEAAGLVASREAVPSAGLAVRARLEDSIAILDIRSDRPMPDRLTFFPADRGVAVAAVTIHPAAGARRAILRLPLIGTPAGALRGVLVAGDPSEASPRGFLVQVPLAPK